MQEIQAMRRKPVLSSVDLIQMTSLNLNARFKKNE
jgi:hypothetical protein